MSIQAVVKHILVRKRMSLTLNKLKPIVLPALMVVGVFFIGFYLNSLRLGAEDASFNVLGIGVVLCSTSLLLSYISVSQSKVPSYCFVTLFILSYGLLMFFTFRYDIFHGADFIGEYVVASTTYSTKRWPIELLFQGSMDRPGRYSSCLSVTIFPAVLSEVTGIEMLPLFRFILPAIGAFLPILLYLVVNRIFENKKLAYLSGMLLGVQYFQIFQMSYMFRQQIGLLFLLLSVYAILKFRQTPLIVFLSFLGVVLANYTISYIFFVVLVAFIVSPLVMRVLRRPERTPLLSRSLITYFLCYVAVMVGWLFFVARPLFNEIVTIIQGFIQVIVVYAPGFIFRLFSSEGSAGEEISGRALGRGFVVDLWYYMTFALIAVGLLYSILRLTNKTKKTVWTTVCFLFVSLFVLNYWQTIVTRPDRLYAVSNVFFVSMVAVTLILVGESKKHRWTRYLKVLVFTFVFLSIPMNLNLPNYQHVFHYQPQNTVTADVRWRYYDLSMSDLQYSEWIIKYVSNEEIIAVDFRGWLITYLSNHLNAVHPYSPVFHYKGSFLIVPLYTLQHEFWITRWDMQVHYCATSNSSWQDDLYGHGIVYNDGKMIMFEQPLSDKP